MAKLTLHTIVSELLAYFFVAENANYPVSTNSPRGVAAPVSLFMDRETAMLSRGSLFSFVSQSLAGRRIFGALRVHVFSDCARNKREKHDCTMPTM